MNVQSAIPPDKSLMVTEFERAEFQKTIEAYCAAWTTETGSPNLHAASQFYAKDADIIYYDPLPPLQGYQGWENLTVGLLKNVYAGLSSLRWVPDDVWVMRQGAIAWGGFKWTITTQSNDGKTTELKGRMTMVWEQRDGKWLIVHEHSSAPYSG